jgi:hypothetical protein
LLHPYRWASHSPHDCYAPFSLVGVPISGGLQVILTLYFTMHM